MAAATMRTPKVLCTGCIWMVNEGFSTTNIISPEVAMATKETASVTAASFLSMQEASGGSGAGPGAGALARSLPAPGDGEQAGARGDAACARGGYFEHQAVASSRAGREIRAPAAVRPQADALGPRRAGRCRHVGLQSALVDEPLLARLGPKPVGQTPARVQDELVLLVLQRDAHGYVGRLRGLAGVRRQPEADRELRARQPREAELPFARLAEIHGAEVQHVAAVRRLRAVVGEAPVALVCERGAGREQGGQGQSRACRAPACRRPCT